MDDEIERGTPSAFAQEVEAALARQVAEFEDSAEFRALESGSASREVYDRFIENLARAHLRSPQLLAFLYALAPPAARGDLLHNLLEELGLEDPAGVAHPALLEALLEAAGLGARRPAIEALADADLRAVVVDPLLYGTLRDVGLAALVEVVAFEYMLARLSGRLARALATHRGLSAEALRWFTHHSEVDIVHALQGLADIDRYARAYGIVRDDALTIVEMTLRDNVFVTRYVRTAAGGPAPAAGR